VKIRFGVLQPQAKVETSQGERALEGAGREKDKKWTYYFNNK